MASKLYSVSNLPGKVTYAISRRKADLYRLNDADGSFATNPADPFIQLTEDAVIKGLFEYVENRIPWNAGEYMNFYFNQVGAGPVPANDTQIMVEEWTISGDAITILARESTLLALQTVGGVITALVDIGQEISSALLPVVMEKGEKLIISVQVLEGGVPKDCTGLTAKLGIKEKLTDTTYKIGPLDGVFSNDSGGVQSILTFTILPAATTALAAFSGLYSAAIYDGGGGNKAPLTDRGGVAFTLREDILDVV